MDAKTVPETREWSILEPGKNCWCLADARRVGVVIDGDDYFEALKSLCAQAERTIFILGWAFDRHEKLGRAPDDPTLEEFLNQLLHANERLQIYLLIWDYHPIYAADREWLQKWRLEINSRGRLHVNMDSSHPPGGSQHQKLVVVDDAAAFCGGIDLTRWRWDTSAHDGRSADRVDADGAAYPPFHDLMMLVDAPVAQKLGELARDRWRRSGTSIEPATAADVDEAPWPDNVKPLFTDQAIAVVRSFPAYQDRERVREIEQLYLDSIARARDYIYMENQYFTSRKIAEALAERLAGSEPPEVILVLPRQTGGWLEQVTMDALRQRQLQRILDADHGGRLRVYFPYQPGLGDDECISVHAKLVLIDDSFLHLGSANASNRSLGLDSECNLALEAPGQDGVPELLHRLLGEHLDCGSDTVRKEREARGSLIEVVRCLQRSDSRSLRLLDIGDSATSVDIGAPEDLVDPEEPVDPAYFLSSAVSDDRRSEGSRRLWLFLGFIVGLCAIALAWRWTPLFELLDPERLAGFLQWSEGPLLRVALVLAGLIVASLLMVPLTLLVVAAALVLGPGEGFVYAMLGALVSASIAYSMGHVLGHAAIERFNGSGIYGLSKKMSEKGVMAVAVLRILPVAPFTVFNLTAGASHIRFGQFMVGSAIGLVPGLGALTLFSGSLYEVVANPSARSLAIMLAVAAVIGLCALVLKRMLR